MANTKQARKRARQNVKCRLHNASFRSLLRTHIKKVVAQIDVGDAEKAKAAYKEAVPMIDKMTAKHLIHSNKAARHKSRLWARIKQLEK